MVFRYCLLLYQVTNFKVTIFFAAEWTVESSGQHWKLNHEKDGISSGWSPAAIARSVILWNSFGAEIAVAIFTTTLHIIVKYFMH